MRITNDHLEQHSLAQIALIHNFKKEALEKMQVIEDQLDLQMKIFIGIHVVSLVSVAILIALTN